MRTLKNEYLKVSVIIPYYNGEKFIAEAIESVMSQTYQNFEIIIVDDGSTDSARAVIEPYITDKRVKFVQHEKNRGIPSARNTGIKHSKGEYVAFLDQDDIWLPEKLEYQVAVFERATTDLGLVFSNVNIADSDLIVEKYKSLNSIPSDINELSHQEVLKFLFLSSNFIPLVTVIVRKECIVAIGLFDETIKGGADDYDICLRLAAKYNIEYLDIPLAVRRVHHTNFSNIERFFHDQLVIMDKIFIQYPSLIVFRKKKLAMLHLGLGRYYQQNEDFHQAKEALWKAIIYQPRQIKPALALLLCNFGRMGNWVLQRYSSAKSIMTDE